MIPDLSGALFVPEFGALLVADLHLEKGTSLARRGVYLPPYDTRESLLQLAAAVQASSPRQLIFLGDSFHDQRARERIDAADLALLRAITATLSPRFKPRPVTRQRTVNWMPAAVCRTPATVPVSSTIPVNMVFGFLLLIVILILRLPHARG